MKHTSQPSLCVYLAWLCIALASLRCASAQTVGQSVPTFPKYQVLGVVYAPPGSASSVTYGNSTLVGSAQSITSGTGSSADVTTSTTVSGSAGLPLGPFVKTSVTYATNDNWTTMASANNTLTVQTTKGNSIASLGPISSSLGVDHDNDVIYILLNPVLTTTVQSIIGGVIDYNWNGISANGCDLSAGSGNLTVYQQVNGCDPNQFPYPDIVGIPVWCLKNPYYPGQGCAQWQSYISRSWDKSYWGPLSASQTGPYPTNPAGLTLQDLADILQADPYVALNGKAINICHPGYGPNWDPNNSESVILPLGSTGASSIPSGDYNPANSPSACGPPGSLGNQVNRFTPYGTVEYPVPGPNGQPSTYIGNFIYASNVQNSTTATDSHMTGSSVETTVTYGFTFGNIDPSGSLSASIGGGTSNSFTTQNSSTNTATTDTAETASYSITGPQLSDNYTGPATYNVYLDTVYGTYAFYSDLEPPVTLGTIGISPTGTFAFTSPAIGTASTPQMVTLTNMANTPLTMVWPAVTFSDPGFQIVENDGSHPDNCSNQYLLANGQTNGLQTYSCTLWVNFVPVFSDAPNTVTLANSPHVLATMIAAGTQNASSYQNILITAQSAAQGTITNTAFGATLIASGQSISALNPVPNLYTFTQPVATGATMNLPSQTFVFTNTSNSASETLQSIALTDAGDFSVLTSGSNRCTFGSSGTIVPPGSTCNVYIQFNPAAGGGSLGSLISISGTYAGIPGTTVLATAAVGGIAVSGGLVVSMQNWDNSNESYDGSYTVVSATNPLFFNAFWCRDYSLPTAQSYYIDGGCNQQFVTWYYVPFQVTNNSYETIALGAPVLSPSESQYIPCIETTQSGPSCIQANTSLSQGASAIYYFFVEYTGPSGTVVPLTPTLTVSGVGATTNVTYSTPVPVSATLYGVGTTPYFTSTGVQAFNVSPGGTAQYTFHVAPQGSNYPGVVTFSATGLPVGATASFSPSTLAANAGEQTVALSIQTPAVASMTLPAFGSRLSPALLALLLLPITASRKFRKSRHKLTRLFSLVLLLAAGLLTASGTIGCGSGSSGGTKAVSSPQSYTITVTATTGANSQSATVSLTVQ